MQESRIRKTATVTMVLLLGVPLACEARVGVLNLAGQWQFLMGGHKPGVGQEALPDLEPNDTIRLPGTTETNRKGPENADRRSGGLTRLYRFNGPAWYRRQAQIPESWRGRPVTLFLERTKYTQVWLDDRPCGENPILCTPQEYGLGTIEPGPHRLTIMVDNTRRPVPGEMHQMSDNTQGNWNGIIGRIELRATDQVWLDDVQVYPGVVFRSVRVKARLGNATARPGHGSLTVRAKGPGILQAMLSTPVTWDANGGAAEIEFRLGDKAQLWDEFQPALHEVKVQLKADGASDERTIRFGLREFATQGSQFAVNDRATFLRGKHDGCVFPITGHPPMDVEGWLTYLGTCRDCGLNHIRFHSWTPPDAAFTAADQLGMYLQPELPFWGDYNEPVRQALMPEAERIIRIYGNHPSFVMLALGNECRGSRAVMAEMIRTLREQDGRHLYAQGSNNFLWDPTLAEGDDYWTTVRVHNPSPKGPIYNVRGSFATVDGGNGHVQIGPPCTMHDYSKAIAGIPVPVIGHEIGQYTMYPDFSEIPRYTGVFRARNLEHFRDRLAGAGMLDQADDFFHSTGRLATICYREDVEAAIRTPGFGGFQLLDLQDFPGQGTALVGLLDAFMENKGAVTVGQWRQFCGPVVLLARFERYIWTADETFEASVQIAHYGPKDLARAGLRWAIRDTQGRTLGSGRQSAGTVRQGGVRSLGQVTCSLVEVTWPTRLNLHLRLEGQGVSTAYPFWVFPPRPAPEAPSGVTLARDLDARALRALGEGGRVVLVKDRKNRLAKTVGGGFATDFWCWPMFHNVPGTMGLLCDPRHPALKDFPTDSHSDWQWFHIVTNSQPVILDALPRDLRPVVQVIDNLDRVHRLGLVFEAKVGKGRLLVCASDLIALSDRPEARQLLASLLAYAGSERFDPKVELTAEAIRDLCVGAD